MSKVLVISGHPNLENSTANRNIIENLKKKLPEITIHRLDTALKDGNFDVKKEQESLLQYDTYVFVSPFHWFSYSALMKKWIDDVFAVGFSHSGGDKLKGKNIVFSFTTGAPAVIYSHDGFLKNTVEELTLSTETMALYTGMKNLGKIISYDMAFDSSEHDDNRLQEILKKAEEHAEKIVKLVK